MIARLKEHPRGHVNRLFSAGEAKDVLVIDRVVRRGDRTPKIGRAERFDVTEPDVLERRALRGRRQRQQFRKR